MFYQGDQSSGAWYPVWLLIFHYSLVFPQKFNKGGMTLLYNVKKYFYFKSPVSRKGSKLSLTLCSMTWPFFSLLGRTERGAGCGICVSDITHLNSTRGPGLVFCVSQGSTCHLVRRPDTGVLARKGVHATHRDTEIALVSFLPNFVSVDIQLFPRIFSFSSILMPLFFTVVYSTKENK